MLCPNCKAQISNGVSFCPNCGRCVDVGEKTERKIGEKNTDFKKVAEEAQAENIKLKKQIKTIAIVVIVLALAAVAFFVVKNMKSDKEKEDGSEYSISIESASVGDYIEFGAYEQDNNTSNGKEPIEWLVLDIKDNKALVVSKYVLDEREYNTFDADITWAECTLRDWLNNEFINEAFSAEAKKIISTVTVVTEDNVENKTIGGKNSADKVFLLSKEEVKMYFDSIEDRACKPTEYAMKKGGGGSWCLRTPGLDQSCVYAIHIDGNYAADYGMGYELGIRPAMWVEIG